MTFFSTSPVVWALPLIVAGGYLLVRGQKGASELSANPAGRYALKPAPSGSSALIVPAWLVVGLLFIVAQGKFYKYHWVLIFPPLLAMGALARNQRCRRFEIGALYGGGSCRRWC